jgi:hypothetical protein
MSARSRNPRRGLQKLECLCRTVAYQTWATIEAGKLPACGECSSRFVPMDLELAALVCSEDELAEHPWYRELDRQAASVSHGQAPHIMGNGRRGMDSLRSPDEVALERVQASMREDARVSQLKGLRRSVEPMPF